MPGVYGLILGLFNLSSGEIVLVLALVFVLWAKNLSDFMTGLGTGIHQFRKAARDVSKEVQQSGYDIGQSLGGIYGGPAAEALTPDNHVAEFWDHEALRKKDKKQESQLPWHRAILESLRAFVVKWIQRFHIGGT